MARLLPDPSEPTHYLNYTEKIIFIGYENIFYCQGRRNEACHEGGDGLTVTADLS